MNVKGNDDKDDMVLKIVAMLITMLLLFLLMMMMMIMIMIIVVMVVVVLVVAVVIIIVKLKIIYIIKTCCTNVLHKLGIRRPINLLEGYLDSQALTCRSQ